MIKVAHKYFISRENSPKEWSLGYSHFLRNIKFIQDIIDYPNPKKVII